MKLRGGKLPEGFVLAKPIAQEGYDESVIYELERQGRLVITRKRDGWRMLGHVYTRGKVRLYTDGLNEIDSRLDHIKKELESFGFPPQTLFVGEIFIFGKSDAESDDLGQVVRIMKAGQDNHAAMIEAGGIHFMVFAIIDLRKKPLMKYNISWFRKEKEGWDNLLASTHRNNTRQVWSVPFLNTTFDDAKKMVVEKGWEGLVLYNEDFQLSYRTNGKRFEAENSWKWKPIREDDFIVRKYIPRSDDTVKKLVLLQIDPKTGKEFDCGKLGSLTNSSRRNFSTCDYPIVIQVRFDDRYPKSGKVRYPRLMRVRDDKPVENCIAPKSYPEAKYV